MIGGGVFPHPPFFYSEGVCMVKKVMSIVTVFCLTSLIALPTGFARPASKPLPPLKISIQPVQSDITPARILPGDIVELRISAVSFLDAPELRVKVELSDGAEFVSGQTAWTGPVVKNGEKVLNLTVRAPQKGIGKVSASAIIPGSQGASFAVESWYELGAHADMKSSLTNAAPKIKKDGKGRDVIEYR